MVQGSLKIPLHPCLGLQVDGHAVSSRCNVTVRFWEEMAFQSVRSKMCCESFCLSNFPLLCLLSLPLLVRYRTAVGGMDVWCMWLEMVEKKKQSRTLRRTPGHKLGLVTIRQGRPEDNNSPEVRVNIYSVLTIYQLPLQILSSIIYNKHLILSSILGGMNSYYLSLTQVN